MNRKPLSGRFLIGALGVVFFLWPILAAAKSDDSRDAPDFLKERERKSFRDNSTYPERLKLLRSVLGRQVVSLQSMVQQQRREDADRILADMREAIFLISSPPAGAPDERRSGEAKKLEIKCRKLIDTLGNLERLVPMEDRVSFEQTSSVLEKFRRQLLEGLFARAPNSMNRPASTDTPDFPNSAPLVRESLFFDRTRAVQQQVVRLPTDDGFTPQEYSLLFQQRSLKDRVKVFMAIAEKRLNGFHFGQAIRGANALSESDSSKRALIATYRAAIRGVMVEIDESARLGNPQDRGVRKALQNFLRSLEGFIPRLVELEGACPPQMSDLCKELRRARKDSELARKRARDWPGRSND